MAKKKFGPKDYGVWASTPQFLGYHNGTQWVDVPCEMPEPALATLLPFQKLVFRADGMLAVLRLANSYGACNVWVGDEAGMRRAVYGAEAVSLEAIGDELYFNRGAYGIRALKDGEERTILEPAPGAFGKKYSPRLFSDGRRLGAFNDNLLYEKAPDSDNWTTTPWDDLWAAAGDDEPWWGVNPPSFFR